MKLLSLICSVILLCGFTYGYRNNTQTGKPDLVVIGAATGDVSGLGGFSLLTPGTLTNTNLCTTNGTTIACTTPTSTVQPAGSYLTANQSITLSGDATGSGTTAITVNVGKINGDVVDSAARSAGDFLRHDGSQLRHVPLASGDIPANAADTTGSAAKWTTGRTIAMTGDVTYTSPSIDGSGNVTAAATVNQAAKLTTARTINGVSFDGSANISLTAANLGLGTWATPTYSAGDFTGSGAMTWGVDAGDVATFRYTILNKVMTVIFYLSTTTVAGTPSSDLKIKIPGGFTSANRTSNVIRYYEGAGWTAGICSVYAANANIYLNKDENGTNWSATTNSTYFSGQITFEIQ